ncbi:MAG: hypothetical protein MJ138_02435, partial [Kiritimatiellae bacterium]|nr:hypothetical protein [Kiritimatiellia bacterium]
IKDAEDKTFYFKATAANHEAVEDTFAAKAEPIAISITSGSYTNWYNGTEQSWPVAVTNSGAAVAGEGWNFETWAHPVGEPTVRTAWSNTYDLVLWEGTKPCNYAFATNHGEIVILSAAVKARAKPGDAWVYQPPSVEAGVALALSDVSEPGEVLLLTNFTDNAEITNKTAGTVVFDLNGFTFTAKDGAPAITYESAPGATLVITNGTVAGEIASTDELGDGDGKVTLADAITTGDFTGAAAFEHLSGTNTWTAAFTGANVTLKGGVFSFDQIAKAAPGYTLVNLGTTPETWEVVPASDLKALIKRVGVEAYERYADLDLALEKVLGSTDVEIFAVTNDAPLTLDLGGAMLTNAIVKLGTGTLTLENGAVNTLDPAFQGDAGAIEVVDGDVIVASATIKSGTVEVRALGGIWGADPTAYCADGYVGTLGHDYWFRVTAKDAVAATTSYELVGGGTVKFHFASFEDALACVLMDYAHIELYNNLELDAPIECTDALVYVAGTESGNGGLPANRITRKAGYEGPLFVVSGGEVAFTDMTVDAGGIGTAVKVEGNAIFKMCAGLVISNAVCAVDAHELTSGPTSADWGFVFADAFDEQVWDNVTNVWITSAMGLTADGPIPGKVGVTVDNADPAMKRLFATLLGEAPYVYPDTAPGVGFFSDEDDPEDMQYWTGLREGNILMFLTQPEAPANDLTLLGRTGASLTIEGTNGLEYAAVKVDGTSTETNFVACTADGAAVVLGGLEPSTEYQILERVAITLEAVASETHAMDTTARTLRYNAAAILAWFDPAVAAAAGDLAESDVAKVEASGLGYKVTLKQDVEHSVTIPEDAADLVIDLAGHAICGDADASALEIKKRNGVNVVAVTNPDPSLKANVTFVNSAETEATIAGADGAKGADGSDAAPGGAGTSAGQGIAVTGGVQHVTITLDGFICVKGGNGGDGGDAVSGAGGAGAQGGLGIIDCMGGRQHDGLTLVVDNPAVTVKGGDGGNGGNSTFGDGGAGGNGALALNLKEAILSAGAFIGGAGGAGGTSGGEGKAGGNGGAGAGSMSINMAIDQITGGSFAGGDGGLGGKGQSGATDGADGVRGRSGQPAAPDPVDVLRVTGVSIEIGVDAYQQFKVVRAADGFEECGWQPMHDTYRTYDLGDLTPSTTYVIYNRFAANDERNEPVSFVASNVVTTTAWGPEQIAAAFQNKATVTMDGTVGTVVTLTDDVTGPVTLPTNYGDITLDLNGHSITGAAGQPAISITGAAGNEDATWLAITNGAETASSLTGGDGADGSPNATTVGYDGAAGAAAIEGGGIVEFVENGGEIFVTGGNGGKGSDTNGAKAGDGGAGGAAVALDYGFIFLNNADAVFTGGNGGDGGDALAGIEGEGGGAGGAGGNAVATWFLAFPLYQAGTLVGGDGGNGGTTRDSSVDAMGGNGGDGGDSGVADVGKGGNGGKGGAGYGGATIDAPNDYTGIGGKGGSGETTGKTGQNGNGSLGACPRVFSTEGATIVQDCSCEAHAHLATATLKVVDSVYDGDAHENATCVMANAEEWLASDPQISYVGDNVNVGVVTAVLSTVAGDLTYAVTNCYNILPAALEDVTVEQDGELVYTGAPQTPAVTAAATAANGQPVTFAYCAEEEGEYGAIGALAFTDAGEYEVFFKATAPNHAEATGSFTVTVKPAELTDVSVEQDGALVYTGAALTPAVTAAATAAGGQEKTFVYGLAEGEYGEAGALPAVTLPGDYTFYYKATAENHAAFESNFTVTVGVATLAGVSVAQNGTPTYTGALQTPAVTTAATAQGGQKVTFTYSYGGGEFAEDLPKFKDAGEYVVAYKANARFHAEATDTFIVKIDKASLVVTANDKTIVYGEAAANDGVRFSGFRGLDDESALELGGLTFDYGDYAPGANAGEYPITPSGVTAANYEISHVAGTLTVEKTSLGGDVSVAQANALKYNGAEQFPELTITTNKYLGVLTFKWGFAKGKYGAVDEKPAITNAGEYVVYYEVSAGENTTSAEGEMTVTIGKRTVELVSGTSTNFWSGMAFTDHVVVTNGDGFVEGEGAVCTFTASIVGDVEEGGAVENAFTWELAEGTLAGNYEITTKAGEIVVKPGVVRASVDGASWVGFGTLSNAFEYAKEGGLVQLVAPYACTNALDGADGSTTETVATYAGATVTLDLNEFKMTGTLSPAGDGALAIIGNGELELVENDAVEPSFQMRDGWKKNAVTGGYEIVRDAEAGGARTTIAGEETFYGSLGAAVAALKDMDKAKLKGDVKIDLWQDESVPAEAQWIVDWEWPINLTIDGNGYTVYDTNRTEQALIAAGGNVVFKDVTFVGERSTGLVEFYGDAATALFKNVTVKGYGRAAKAAGEGSSLPLIANVDVVRGVELTLDGATIEGNDVDCVVMAGYEPDAETLDGYLPITVRVKGATRVCGNGDRNVVLASADRLVLAGDFTGRVGVTPVAAYAGSKVGEIGGAFAVAAGAYAGAENFVLDADAAVYGALNGAAIAWTKDATVAVTIDGVAAEVVVKTATGTPTMDLTAFVTDAKHLTRDTTIVLPNAGGDYDGLAVSAPAGWKATVTAAGGAITVTFAWDEEVVKEPKLSTNEDGQPFVKTEKGVTMGVDNAVPGFIYRLQQSDRLEGGTWTTVAERRATGAKVVLPWEPDVLPSEAFFRTTVNDK